MRNGSGFQDSGLFVGLEAWACHLPNFLAALSTYPPPVLRMIVDADGSCHAYSSQRVALAVFTASHSTHVVEARLTKTQAIVYFGQDRWTNHMAALFRRVVHE
jgi:hypothetical protein